MSSSKESLETDSCYRQQFKKYPESKVWVDSLRSIGALRNTFLTMPSGERHHAFFVDRGKAQIFLHEPVEVENITLG